MTNRERLHQIIDTLPESEMGLILDFFDRLMNRQLDQESKEWLGAVEPLEPYDWGEIDPMTLGQTVEYKKGIGAIVADD